MLSIMSTTPGHTFASQLLSLIIRPTLNSLSLGGGQPAEMLVLGTAAVESGFSAIKQIGGGPALSLWQIEPATVRDTWNRGRHRDVLSAMIPECPDWEKSPKHDELVEDMIIGRLPGDLYLGCAMCRLVYYLKPFKMPTSSAGGIGWAARIWKQHYNTPLGAGTEQDFINAWKKYDLGSLWP